MFTMTDEMNGDLAPYCVIRETPLRREPEFTTMLTFPNALVTTVEHDVPDEESVIPRFPLLLLLLPPVSNVGVSGSGRRREDLFSSQEPTAGNKGTTMLGRCRLPFLVAMRRVALP